MSRKDRIVTVLTQTQERDAMNAIKNVWTPSFTTRARAYPAPGSERAGSDQQVAFSPVVFEFRPESRTLAISPSNRLLMDEVEYGISSVLQPERGRDVRVMATAERK